MSEGESKRVQGGASEIEMLRRLRAKERVQAHFYRALAAEAEERGEEAVSERLNGLHADEQHHLSRITARILELGEAPGDLADAERIRTPFEAWAETARRREEEEVALYSELLAGELEAPTRAILEEILESELHHREELGGKWMPA